MKKNQIEEFRRARQNRYFSEEFKKRKVKEIENNLTKISDVSRTYEVTRTAVYKWIYKYSTHRKRQVKQVIEDMSDTKKIKELQERIKELEQMVGRQQMIIDFKGKMIDIAEDHYGINIKKNLGSKQSDISRKTKKKGGSR